MQQAGKLMMLGGGFIFLAGIILFFGGKYFRWFGHLPGDVSIERDNFKFYMPLASMLIVSAVISLLFWIIRKFIQ